MLMFLKSLMGLTLCLFQLQRLIIETIVVLIVEETFIVMNAGKGITVRRVIKDVKGQIAVELKTTDLRSSTFRT